MDEEISPDFCSKIEGRVERLERLLSLVIESINSQRRANTSFLKMMEDADDHTDRK